MGVAAALTLRFVSWSGPASIPFVYFSTFARADGILLGCLLAIVWRHLPKIRFSPWIGLLGLVLILGSSVPSNQGWIYVWAPTAADIGAVAVILWAMDRPSFLGWSGLTIVGRLSYSLYLWSPPLMLWVFPRLHLGGAALEFAACFAAAAASYLLVERPLLSLKDRFLGAESQRQVP